MFSPALTTCRNSAMLTRQNLKKDNPTIQAFVKYPAKLMAKKEGEKRYSLYAEYSQLSSNQLVLLVCRDQPIA